MPYADQRDQVANAQRWRERDLATNPTLTTRELEVATLLRSGLSPSDVAAELGIARGSVKRLTAQIYRRLGIQSRAELMSARSGRAIARGGRQ
jgi:DNA-binding NarL/FixJ family response regulator